MLASCMILAQGSNVQIMVGSVMNADSRGGQPIH